MTATTAGLAAPSRRYARRRAHDHRGRVGGGHLTTLVCAQVGNLWDGAGLNANAAGGVVGMKLDSVIRLGGVNNIVGRSLIIHGNGTLTTPGKAARVAQVSVAAPA